MGLKTVDYKIWKIWIKKNRENRKDKKAGERLFQQTFKSFSYFLRNGRKDLRARQLADKAKNG